MRYVKIRDEFEQRIKSGVLKAGDRLPPEIELSGRYATSRGTIARALRELEAKGLVNRRRGAGTFVSEPKPSPRSIARLAMFTPWVVQGEFIGAVQTRIHAGLSSLCAEHGAELTLQGLTADGRDYRARLFHAADQITQRETSAVLFCPAELDHDQMQVSRDVVDHLRRSGCPVVLIDRDIVSYPDRSRLPWVAYDNRRGATLLARHMIEQGYRRIAFVGIPQDSTAVQHRLAGYIDGLRLGGLAYDPALVFQTTQAPDLAFSRRLLAEGKPDAIIAKDSHFAARIGSSLLAEGRDIGPDIGLAGFDDDPSASVLHVPLTIVRQPVEPFVKAAYQTVLRVLEGAAVEGEQVILPTELVPRASTRRSG